MEVKLSNLKLKNPVLLASGTYEKNIAEKIDISKLGGLITKTITPRARSGNLPPRIIKTKYGFLNSDGWRNPGIKKFLKEDLPFWKKFQTEIIPSIGGFSEKDFIDLTIKFNNQNVNAIEINTSCPNVHKGIPFGTNPKIIKRLIKKIRKEFKKTLIVKLNPNVADITELAEATLKGGADILSLANTFLALEIDNKKKKARFHRITAGYSGPAIKPMSIRMVWEVYKKLRCPIIASGGIENLDDTLDYIMCGASAVAIGSANFTNPKSSIKIVDGLKRYYKENKIKDINQIRGII